MKQADINNLSDLEKLKLISDLWDTIDKPDELIPFDTDHKNIIDKRLKEMEKDPSRITIDQLKAALQSLHD